MESAEELGIEGVDEIETLDIEGSAIYRARQFRHNRVVAIKILDPHQEPLLPKRFDLRRKQHQRFAEDTGVVSLYDIGETSAGEQYIVMPFFRIGSLADQLGHGPMPWHRAAELVRRTSEIVARAHALGVVLADLKPSSVLLADADSPMIAMYGMATRRFDDGTPSYRAPEANRGANATPAADVYSLALTLASLIAGRAPNRGPLSAGFLNEVEALAPTRIVQVIEQGLSSSSSDRFQSAADLAEALGTAIRGDEPSFGSSDSAGGADVPLDLDALLGVGPPPPVGPSEPAGDQIDNWPPPPSTPEPNAESFDLAGAPPPPMPSALPGAASADPFQPGPLPGPEGEAPTDDGLDLESLLEQPLVDDPPPPFPDADLIVDLTDPAPEPEPEPADGSSNGAAAATEGPVDADSPNDQAESEPTELEPTELEPTELEPTGSEPTESKPTESKPAELEPVKLVAVEATRLDDPPEVELRPAVTGEFQLPFTPSPTKAAGAPTQISIVDIPDEVGAADQTDNIDLRPPAAETDLSHEQPLIASAAAVTGTLTPEDLERAALLAETARNLPDVGTQLVTVPHGRPAPALDNEDLPFRAFERQHTVVATPNPLIQFIDPIQAAWIQVRRSLGALLALIGFAVIAGVVAMAVLRGPQTAATAPNSTFSTVQEDGSPSTNLPTSQAPVFIEPPNTHQTTTTRRVITTTASTAPPAGPTSSTAPPTTRPPSTRPATTRPAPTTQPATTARPPTSAPTTLPPTTAAPRAPTTRKPATTSGEIGINGSGSGSGSGEGSGEELQGPTEPLIEDAAVSRIRATTAQVHFSSSSCVTASFSYAAAAGGTTRSVSGGSRCNRSYNLLLGTITPRLNPGTTYTVTITATDRSGSSTTQRISFTTLG